MNTMNAYIMQQTHSKAVSLMSSAISLTTINTPMFKEVAAVTRIMTCLCWYLARMSESFDPAQILTTLVFA